MSDRDLFDLIDLPEAGTVDWDALGFGCREPFYRSTLKARLKKKRAKTSVGAVSRGSSGPLRGGGRLLGAHEHPAASDSDSQHSKR